MVASGEDIPQAIAERKYSGAFKVRIPPQQHRRLALEASRAGREPQLLGERKAGGMSAAIKLKTAFTPGFQVPEAASAR